MSKNMENSKHYDAIIIGAGLSGLNAAYFLAKSGYKIIVFELLPKKGQFDHPCGCMISPINNYITFEPTSEGIYFKELDFTFTSEMILCHPGKMEFFMPNGCKFGMNIDNPKNYNIFQVDKTKLLHNLAQRAENAGALLQYGTTVSKLIIENEKINGIITQGNEYRAKLILSGEGLSRRFSKQAGLYENDPFGFIFTYALYLDNLNLTDEELGQFGYFGENLIEIPNSSIMFHSYGHNKGLLIISAYLDEYKWTYEKSVEEYLLSAIFKIDFLKDLFKKGAIYDKKGCWMKLNKPDRLISNGFIGMGDAVAPIGHSSNSIAMFMGKKAAQIAINALKNNQFGMSLLKNYNDLLKEDLFRGIEFEANLITSILQFPNEELNKICKVFKDVNLKDFFIGTKWDILKAFIRLMFKKEIIKNWKIIRKLF